MEHLPRPWYIPDDDLAGRANWHESPSDQERWQTTLPCIVGSKRIQGIDLAGFDDGGYDPHR